MNDSAADQYADLVWRKSSRSNGEGATQCVEAASSWRKSSRSNGQGATDCVEAASCPHHVALRDSKLAHLPGFPVLTMSTTDWNALLAAVS